MKILHIENFKAFNAPIDISINGKNMLLYGENGAGKSSLFEAIKLIFLKDLLEQRKIRLTSTPEDQEQQRNDLYSAYNNSQNKIPFHIRINDINYDSFDASKYQVFLISPDNLSFGPTISLKETLEKCWFKIDNLDQFIQSNHTTIAQEISKELSESFKENISLSFDTEDDDFKCILTDVKRSLTRKSELHIYFNEAKLHLVKLLILLTSIRKLINSDNNIKKILVLDDFISSLDAANRTFIIKYIQQKFTDTQKIILTHNIGFFNLTKYLICGIEQCSAQWTFLNLYMIGSTPRIYTHSTNEKVEDIKSDYKKHSTNIESIGNRIRKKFEILLHELSKLHQIGTYDTTAEIIENIEKKASIYLEPDKLISKIRNIADSVPASQIKQEFQGIITQHEITEFSTIKSIIKDLTLYQKVTMHPMSHGTSDCVSSFTTKEIEESLILLKKMEDCIKKFQSKNVNDI